jgi:hypothetical protein
MKNRPLEDRATKSGVSPLSIDEALIKLEAERASSATNQPVMREVGEGPVSRWLSLLVATTEIVGVFVGLLFRFGAVLYLVSGGDGHAQSLGCSGPDLLADSSRTRLGDRMGSAPYSPACDLGVVGAGSIQVEASP